MVWYVWSHGVIELSSYRGIELLEIVFGYLNGKGRL